MLRRHVRRICVLTSTAALVAVPAVWSGPAQAAGAAPAVVAPTFTNGLVAYECLGRGGVGGAAGWVDVPAVGGTPTYVPWTAGAYSSGVQWSADGSEMVHVAALSAAARPTVVVSESDGSFPWQDTNFAQATGVDRQRHDVLARRDADPVHPDHGQHRRRSRPSPRRGPTRRPRSRSPTARTASRPRR